MQSIIKYEFNEHLTISKKTMESVGKPIEIAAEICIDCLKKVIKSYYLAMEEVQQMLNILLLK